MDYRKKVGLNALFLIVTLIVNALGGFGLINGLSQSDISNEYFTLVTPSGMTFSIWSLIYGLLVISIGVMYWKRNDPYYQRAIDKISPLFIVTCILNMLWIVLFSFALVEISTVVILIFTLILAIICIQLLAINDGKHFLLPITFGIYTGWLMIATVVNTSASLVKIGWNGFGIADEVWTIIILIVALLLVSLVTFNTQNASLPLPVAWAYYGINQNLATAHEGDNGILRLITVAGIVILIGVAAIQFYKNKYHVLPRETTNRLKFRTNP